MSCNTFWHSSSLGRESSDLCLYQPSVHSFLSPKPSSCPSLRCLEASSSPCFTAWLSEFRKQLTAATEVGRFLEMWNIRETHPKERSVRTLVGCRVRAPDPSLPEYAQSISKLAHILHKLLHHRKGIEQEGPAPPTNNERKLQSQLEHRRKRTEGKSMRLTSQSRLLSGVSKTKTNDFWEEFFGTAWHLVAFSVSWVLLHTCRLRCRCLCVNCQ